MKLFFRLCSVHSYNVVYVVIYNVPCFLQNVAFHSMPSISFASGGDAVSTDSFTMLYQSLRRFYLAL